MLESMRAGQTAVSCGQVPGIFSVKPAIKFYDCICIATLHRFHNIEIRNVREEEGPCRTIYKFRFILVSFLIYNTLSEDDCFLSQRNCIKNSGQYFL